MSERHVPFYTGTMVGPLTQTNAIYELTEDHGVDVDGAHFEDSDLTGLDDLASNTVTTGTLTANTSLSTDLINEASADTGVTVDGVLFLDNGVTATLMDFDTVSTDQISEKTPTAGLNVVSQLKATDGTVSTTPSTGAVVASGGLGVSGAAYFGGTGLRTDAMDEENPGAGVTIDGVLFRDNDVTGSVLVANSGVQTDSISEKTPAAGVAVPSVLRATAGSSVTGGVGVSGDLWAGASLITDAIAEETPTAGVTIDGVLLKDFDATAEGVVTSLISEKTTAAGVTVEGTLFKDDAIQATDNVYLPSETLTLLTDPISTTIPTTIIDLATPTGETKAWFDNANTGLFFTLATGADKMRKTILLQEGQTDWVTIRADTAFGSFPFCHYFTLNPNNRVLHLRYETDHWEQEAPDLIDDYFLMISELQTNTGGNWVFNEDGTRAVMVFGSSTTRQLWHYTIDNNDLTQVEIIDLNAGGVFAYDTSFMNNTAAVAMSYDGSVVVIGNYGDYAGGEPGEAAVFRLSGGLYVHDVTFTPSVPATYFGYCVSLSADGTLFGSADTSSAYIFTLSPGSAVQTATFAMTGGSVLGTAISGDGHWFICGEVTGSNSFVYSDMPTGSWALFQTFVNQTSFPSGMALDYYGTTACSGDRTFSSNRGIINVYFRKPGDLTTNAFSNAVTQTVYYDTAGGNRYAGSPGYFQISADGLKMAWNGRYTNAIFKRSSLQEAFALYAEGDVQNFGASNISPNGDLVSFSVRTGSSSSGPIRPRIYRTAPSLGNRTLLDSSEANGLALVKGNFHVGGDLSVTGALETPSLTFDAGTNTMDTLVNQTTWTTTALTSVGVTGTGTVSNAIYCRKGDAVRAHFVITGFSTTGTGPAVFGTTTLPVASSVTLGNIGNLCCVGASGRSTGVYVSTSGTYVGYFTHPAAEAITIYVTLKYIV